MLFEIVPKIPSPFGILKFLKSIYDGKTGDALVAEYNKGYTDGTNQHGILSLGLNKLFESFTTSFSKTLKDEDKTKFADYIKADKDEVKGEGAEVQEKINAKTVDPNDY